MTAKDPAEHAAAAAAADGAGAPRAGTPAAAVRSFVALPLPAELQEQLMRAAQELAAALPEVRVGRKPENLHLTLKFLGPVAPARLDELTGSIAGELRKLGELAALAPPAGAFPAEVVGLGAFPGAADASVIWAGVEDGGAGRLAAVAEAVERAAARLGFPREPRAFRAHVTVARCKRRVDARRALGPFRGRGFGRFTVSELHVYESILGRDGLTYILRGRAPIAAGGA